MKKVTEASRMLIFLFCIAIASIGMCSPYMETDPSLLSADSLQDIFKELKYHNRIDVCDEVTGVITAEAAGDILSDIRVKHLEKKVSFRVFFLPAAMPSALLMVWMIFKLLLRDEAMTKLLLIRFIHDSDGEKGRSARADINLLEVFE